MNTNQPHHPEPDVAEQYSFDLDVILPGDILLSSDNTRVSKIISKATNGIFSHAMLNAGMSLIHAMPDGVYSKNPQRYLRADPRQRAVYRLTPEYLKDNIISDAIMFARSQVGALYSVPAAMLSKSISKLKAPPKFDASKQFCSRLVAQAYAYAGINIVGSIDFCSPNDIARSEFLIPVQNGVKKLTSAEISFAKSPDFNTHLQSINFLWLDKTRRLASRRGLGNIATENDVMRLVLENPGLDKVISGYITDSEYPNFYNWDRKKNPHRYDVKDFLRKSDNKDVLIFIMHKEIEGLNYDLQRHQLHYDAMLSNYGSYTNLRYVNIQIELAKNLLNEAITRRDTLINVAKEIDFPLQIHGLYDAH
jgi:hypothetical protein